MRLMFLSWLAVASAPSPAQHIDAVMSKYPGFTGQVLVSDLQRTTAEWRRGDIAKDAAWPWASVSKQVVATMAMRAVADGKLSLDDRIDRWFNGPREFDAPTILQLMQHRSGLFDPDAGAEEGNVPAFFAPGGPDAPQRLERCATSTSAPGGDFSYNNCDYLLLGRVLEQVNGQAFAAQVRAMFGDDVHVAPDAATTRDFGAEGPPVRIAAYEAGGALVGPAEALARFDRRLLDDELLPRASRDRLWQGDPSAGYAALGVWSFEADFGACGKHAVVERRGEIGAFQVRNVLLPADGRALVVFTREPGVTFGEIWQQSGLTYDLLEAVACQAPGVTSSP